MILPFVKMQAAGNDFVAIDGRSLPEQEWSAVARALCDRHRGVGADGLLLLLLCPEADFRLRMFNPDGTEDTCGNGLRCAARYAAHREWASRSEMRVLTRSGIQSAVLEPDGQVTVSLGRASFHPGDIPARTDAPEIIDWPLGTPAGELRITSLTTGSAHTVIFGATPVGEEQFQAVSPWLETHPLFPERTSVLWATPLGPNFFQVRIWERGAGETLACGTGAAAVAAAACRLGRARSPVGVRSRGGTLTVAVGNDLHLRLTGPAVEVFRGEIPLPAPG
ncbi:MAG: diaminopimelate epimerase [Armatimonadetes bacterium]|nr:diaminopimelate epimerase [Armatimonadota bacterium]